MVNIRALEMLRQYDLNDYKKNSFCVSATAAAAKPLQSCPTLCDPIESGSPSVSPFPGILQARILEWVGEMLKYPEAI